MKFKSIFLIVSSLLVCTLLQACGGSRSSSTMTPPIAALPKTLDTAQVQLLTQTSSETVDPIAVNDGLVTVAGSSDEISDPAVVSNP